MSYELWLVILVKKAASLNGSLFYYNVIISYCFELILWFMIFYP
jgi:hypothetical protein